MRWRRSTLIGLALFTAFSVTVTWMVMATLQRPATGPTNTYSAMFTDVSGMAPGDDVRVAGVRVGRVDDIELVGTQARVTFRVERKQTIYTNTIASVTYQNAIGQRYLSLLPGPPGESRPLEAGSEIPQERTNPSLDISYMLNGFEPLFTELDPEQVDNLTNALIEALQGDSGSILALTTQASALAHTLAGPDQVLGDLIVNFNELMASLATQNTNLQDLIRNARGAMADLANRRDALIASAGSVNATAARLADIVATITPNVQEFIGRQPGFMHHWVYDGRERMAYMAANLPLMLKGFARISQEGSYFNSYICDAEFNLWRGLYHWLRAFVRAATPGGGELWQSPICR